MIPRTIHSCHFGSKMMSELEVKCRESWTSLIQEGYCLHTLQGGRDIKSDFFHEALRVKPVNASNYARLWMIYRDGGIYLDNDFEIVRDFGELHRQDCFVSFQRVDQMDESINTAAIGCVAGHPFIKSLLDRMEHDDPNGFPVWGACTYPTLLLCDMGMKGVNVEQKVGDVMVYDRERFFPYWHDQDPNNGTDRTFAVHRWAKTWAS